MIYLDNGATSFHKPPTVADAMLRAMRRCANPGRGGHVPAMNGARTVLQTRLQAAKLFDCEPEQVTFTSNCTHGLNIAIHSLVKPGSRVAVTGFEHNAVTRPLFARGCETVVAGRRLFDWPDTLSRFEDALKQGVSAAVFTHCSNVFGYILPVDEMAYLCKKYAVPFIIDGAQSAGILSISLKNLGADFIAMPGHKGLLGPQGTGILLCGKDPIPLIQGGTGSASKQQNMPDILPDALEAGTVNVPGIAGLGAGIAYLQKVGIDKIFRTEQRQTRRLVKELQSFNVNVFSGANQAGTVSFVPAMDGEEMAFKLSEAGIAVRAGLHCAPLAHDSAGTLDTGTVRVSFGHDACDRQTDLFLDALRRIG